MASNGAIPADNPFNDGAGPNVDATWALGLRNPYRFSFDSLTGRMLIGDVGQNTFEEVNVGIRGANYGWPTCEGTCGNPGMTNPIYSYPHNNRDAAITGGFVYRGTQFPARFFGDYFYADFAQNLIRYLALDEDGNITGSMNFVPEDGTPDGPIDPIMLKQGPDGSLVYVDFGWGWQESVNPAAIRRVRFITGNLPPVTQVAAQPLAGSPPLGVNFSSSGSFDPEGLPLSYAWDFGDGTGAAEPNPTHTYLESGVFEARLSLSDGELQTISQSLTISVGTPPVVRIDAPADDALFRAGDIIQFSGTATDTEDGALPLSAYSWTILFHHDTHVHPTLGPVSGQAGGSFTVPASGHSFEDSTSYEIILTAIDSTGLQRSTSVYLYPDKVNLTFVSDPAALSLNIDGVPRSAPFTLDTVAGFRHNIGAPDQAIGTIMYEFVSWSDGGPQSHLIVVGESTDTYTALFHVTAVEIFPAVSTVTTGTPAGGDESSLLSDDDDYFLVNSTRNGTRTTAWYGAFSDVPNDLSGLRVRYKGKNSRNCTQTISLWNWSLGAWTPLDVRVVGTTEVDIAGLAPAAPLGDFVSGANGNGEVRIQVRCQAGANFTARGDLLTMTYEAPIGPPPPDTTPPVRWNGAPSGTLPGGSTVATLSLTTDEHCNCRYATDPDVDFEDMTLVMDVTGATSHSTTVTGIEGGESYSFRIRCQDYFGNANSDDFLIQFSVAEGGALPGLVAAYGFEEGGGASVSDVSGNGHTGAISGASWTAQGRYGGALSFNGSSNLVTVGASPLLNLTSGMTLEAWINPTAASGTRDVLIKEGTNVDLYNLYARNWRGRPESNVYAGGANRVAEGATLPTNTWSHLAGTYDGTTLRLYVNGVQVASAAYSGTIGTSSGPLRIGGNSLWGEYFQGAIDEVRIYNRALTALEIQTDMNTAGGARHDTAMRTPFGAIM